MLIPIPKSLRIIHYLITAYSPHPNSSPQRNVSQIIFTTQCLHAKSLHSCLTLCDPLDCSPPGSSVHGILQARIVPCLPSEDLPDPVIELTSLMSPALAGGFFTTSAKALTAQYIHRKIANYFLVYLNILYTGMHIITHRCIHTPSIKIHIYQEFLQRFKIKWLFMYILGSHLL